MWVRLGCGDSAGDCSRVAQRADEEAHLGKSFTTRSLDRHQGLPFLFLLRSEHAPDSGSLHGHHADAVADDVM